MKPVFSLAILCCFLVRLAGADLVATATIIDVGRTREGRDAFVVQADVRNRSAAPVVIAMMTCSWSDSWRVEPTRDFTIPIWACDSNFPAAYTFPPGGGFSFRFLVQSSDVAGKAEGKSLKFGFICSRSSADLRKAIGERDKDVPMIWTNELTAPRIPDRILTSSEERKELPNQSPEPTPMLGTSAAEQPLVPSTVVAHL